MLTFNIHSRLKTCLIDLFTHVMFYVFTCLFMFVFTMPSKKPKTNRIFSICNFIEKKIEFFESLIGFKIKVNIIVSTNFLIHHCLFSVCFLCAVRCIYEYTICYSHRSQEKAVLNFDLT